ncbi:hypothetical protein LL06_00860 [Hoeflea sp. BAL378]|nr:hypothetical protein LL06_00860 [Hoeflea sp. BAL378]
MPIPTPETELAMKEIEAGLFRQAFVELALAFARRDPRGFALARHDVHAALGSVDVKKITPRPRITGSRVDIELVQEQGLRRAFEAYEEAVREIVKRGG